MKFIGPSDYQPYHGKGVLNGGCNGRDVGNELGQVKQALRKVQEAFEPAQRGTGGLLYELANGHT
jgi:hypothetical protein